MKPAPLKYDKELVLDRLYNIEDVSRLNILVNN